MKYQMISNHRESDDFPRSRCSYILDLNEKNTQITFENIGNDTQKHHTRHCILMIMDAIWMKNKSLFLQNCQTRIRTHRDTRTHE